MKGGGTSGMREWGRGKAGWRLLFPETEADGESGKWEETFYQFIFGGHQYSSLRA